MSEEPILTYPWRSCLRCNPAGVERRPRTPFATICPDCGGSGWTESAAFALEPWSVIIPGLWQGGCLYNQSRSGRSITQAIVPDDTFDVIVSVYQGATNYGPGLGHPAHYVFPFVDEEALSDYALKQLKKATEVTSQAVTEGASVLVRCQAGLNRSGLVVASTLIQLGYKPEDAVQIIRARRSPWALCNETFVNHLLAQELVATPC